MEEVNVTRRPSPKIWSLALLTCVACANDFDALFPGDGGRVDAAKGDDSGADATPAGVAACTVPTNCTGCYGAPGTCASTCSVTASGCDVQCTSGACNVLCLQGCQVNCTQSTTGVACAVTCGAGMSCGLTCPSGRAGTLCKGVLTCGQCND